MSFGVLPIRTRAAGTRLLASLDSAMVICRRPRSHVPISLVIYVEDGVLRLAVAWPAST